MDCFCSSLFNNVLYCSVPYNDSDVSRMCDLLLLYKECGLMQKRERLVFVVSVVNESDVIVGGLCGLYEFQSDKFVPCKFKESVLRSISEKCVRDSIEACWVVPQSGDVEDMFVPQGGNVGPEVGGYSDWRSVECPLLNRDPEVSGVLVEKWNGSGWPCMSREEFCGGFPALYHDSCNWCDVCGGVDMCKHILVRLCPEIIDLSYPVRFALEAAHELLGLRERPLEFSLASPYLRYIVARSFVSLSDVPEFKFWISALESECVRVYPNVYVAQFSPDLSFFSAVISAVTDFFGSLPVRLPVGDFLRSVVGWINDAVGSASNFVGAALISFTTERIKSALGSFWESSKEYVIMLVKTLVRIAMDYSPSAVMLEILWESTVINSICSRLGLFSSMNPQSLTDIGAVISTLAVAGFVGLGKVNVRVKPISELILSMVLAAAAFNRASLWDQVNALVRWFDGGEIDGVKMAAWNSKFPNSMRLYTLHSSFVGSVCSASQNRSLILAYQGYLTESSRFGSDRSELMSILSPAVRFVQNSGLAVCTADRCRPSVFMFNGPTNIGKSTLVNLLANTIALYNKSNYPASDGGFSPADAIYTVQVHDEYASGYRGQDIWIFDEWLQSKDSEINPSASVSLLFNLVSTNTIKLVMAGVEEKGMEGTCSIVLGATNLSLKEADIGGKIKSVNDPRAVSSRLNFRVSPHVKLPYFYDANLKCIMKKGDECPVKVDESVSPQELYEFVVTSAGDRQVMGDLEGGKFSWFELVRLAQSEYKKVRDYTPMSSSIDLSMFGPMEGDGDVIVEESSGSASAAYEKSEEGKEFHPEGWGDILQYFSKPKRRIMYVEFDDEIAYIDEDRVIVCGPDDKDVIEGSYVDDSVGGGPGVLLEAFECESQRVYFKLKEGWRTRDVFIGLLVGAVVCAGVVPLARKLVQKARDAWSDGSVVVDGVRYYMDGEAGCYSSQAQIVETGGRKYAVVRTKSGVRWYPEGYDFSGLVDNQRLKQQVPLIYDSLFAVIVKDVVVGNAFALHDSALILPTHVCVMVENHGGFIFNGRLKIWLGSLRSLEVSSYYTSRVGADFSTISLNSLKLNGIRNGVTRLARHTSKNGFCRRVFRCLDGSVETVDDVFGISVDPVVYVSGGEEYKWESKDVRQVDSPGFPGLCGALYINVLSRGDSKEDGGVIAGMHVAANMTTNKRVFATFDSVRLNLAALVSSCYPPLEGCRNGVGSVFGYESGKLSHTLPVELEGRLGVTTVPVIAGVPRYAVARLRTSEGIDPLANGIIKADEYHRRVLEYPKELEEITDELIDWLLQVPYERREFSTLETFTGAGVLPSIRRSAASGYPFDRIHPTKMALCLSEEELAAVGLPVDAIRPSPETINLIEELETRMKYGETFESVCKLSVKEEPRLAEKVAIGATRLFAGAPAHEFILQRKWFMVALSFFLEKNLAVGSALGLEPSDARSVHDWLLLNVENPAILTCDYKGKDSSVNPKYMQLVGRVLRSVCEGRRVGYEVVSEGDFFRSVLLKRISFHRLGVGDELYEPKGGHPSGSALTTLINITSDLIDFTYGLSKMMKLDAYDVLRKVKMIFLGDDSIVSVPNGARYDLSVFVSSIKACGMTITAADKTDTVAWLKPYNYESPRSEYNFLSRHYTVGAGVLSLERLAKMLCFCEVNRALEVVPSAMLSFQEELRRYADTGQIDWLEAIRPQLNHFGFLDVDLFLKMTPEEISEAVVRCFAKDNSKMAVVVPAYNRHVVRTPTHIAQGNEEEKAEAGSGGEAVPEEKLGDATFVAGLDGVEVHMDSEDHKYLEDHMDPVNFVPPNVFERPVSTVHGNTGTTVDAIVANLSAPSSYFLGNFNAQAKLANGIFMRCVFCVKLIVASGPFVSGKLILSFRPGALVPLSANQAASDPCVELDVASGRSAIIRFPTVIPGNWMMIENFSNPVDVDTYSVGFDYGVVSIWTLTDLSESIPFTVYTWLEEVQIRGTGFTAWDIAPQGKTPKGKSKSKGGAVKGSGSKETKGGEKGESLSAVYEKELEMKKWSWKVENTPDWLNSVAASIETVGGAIQCVEESILGPVGDFVDKVGDDLGAAVAMFGMCVPSPVTHIKAYFQSPNWAQAQMMAPVPGVRLAVVQNQRSIQPRALWNNKADEMIISDFVARFGIVGKMQWRGGYDAGHNLGKWNVMPGVMPFGGGDPFICHPHPLGFVAGTFRLWRGNILYRLSVAKTAFHTGMLEIIWQNGLCTATPSTPGQDALSQRIMWDVTQSSSIEFEVPYVARSPFTQIYFCPFGSIVSASDLTTGLIYLNVVNPLTVAGGVVASDITIVLYVAGGTGIEFSMPGKHSQLSAFDPGASLNVKIEKSREREVSKKKRYSYIAQGGPFGDEEVVDGLGGGKQRLLRVVPNPTPWAHLSTMGERVLSLRMIIKRFGRPVALPSTFDYGFAISNTWYLAYVSHAFFFYVGSWRANVLIPPLDYQMALPTFTWALNWNGPAIPGAQDGCAHMSILPWSNATVLEVPWYSNIAFREISDIGPCVLEGPNPEDSTVEFAAGDDFSFGFQIGVDAISYSLTLPPPLY